MNLQKQGYTNFEQLFEGVSTHNQSINIGHEFAVSNVSLAPVHSRAG